MGLLINIIRKEILVQDSINCVGVVERFLWGTKGEEILLTLLTGMLHFWEYTRRNSLKENIMVTLQRSFIWKTGDMYHIFPLVYVNWLVL